MTEVAGKVSVEALLQRATSGDWLDRSKILKPSQLWRLMNDPWGVYMDHHGPLDQQIDETSLYEKRRMDAGSRFEREWVAKHYPNALKIESYGIEGLQQTLAAMVRGVSAIWHPQLYALRHEIGGQGDLLVKCDSRSGECLLGHAYRLLELKKSSKLAPHHTLQAAAYGLALEQIQGEAPAIDVVLPDGEHAVALEEVRQDVLDHVQIWKEIKDGTLRPDVPGYDDALSPWRVYANRLLVERKDVTQIAGYTRRVRQILRDELAVRDLDDLARLQLSEFMTAFSDESATRRYWQARAWVERRPILLPGKVLRIPRRPRRAYFDVETSDGVHPTEPPHCYMIGLLEDGRYQSFVARGAGDEERMFREFLAYVGRPSQIHLYHWTRYEIGVLEDVAERHPCLARKLKLVVDACVDLYRLIKEAVVLPVSSYSIKDVAPSFNFRWRQAGVDGLTSMTLYWDWLAGASDDTIGTVLAYNEDDVRAMRATMDGLRRANVV